MGEKQNGPFQLSFNAVKGCYRKVCGTLMPLGCLNLRASAVSAREPGAAYQLPLNPRNVDGAGFLWFSAKECRIVEAAGTCSGSRTAADFRSPGTSGTAGGAGAERLQRPLRVHLLSPPAAV